MLNEAELNSAISKVLGDYQNQYTIEIATELKNTIRWITTNYTFIWNIAEDTDLGHINGIIEMPPTTGKILQIVDSNGEDNYMLAPREKFQIQQRSVDELYPSEGATPFIVTENASTGNVSIIFETDIDTDLTFNVLRTQVYSQVSEIAGLDRLYPALLGRTVYSMLVQTENPDTALLTMYDKMFQECMVRERDLSNNRALLKFNTNVVSPSLRIDRKSKGI